MVGFDVDLYEDNAGGLFLHPMNSDWVYETEPNPEMTFEIEAKALCENEVAARDNWSEEWVHGYAEMLPSFQHPETHLIATWHNDAPITIHCQPGRAGERYLHMLEA